MSDLAQRCLGARTASAEVNIVADEPAKPGSELTDEYFRLLDLSSELRLLVYEAYIGNAVWQIDDKKSYLTCGPLRSVCKLILNEFDPLYTQAQWQIRCIEADVKSFNFGRLIEFPGDDVCDDSYCSPQDETLSTEIDPFVINITMTFEHQLSVEPHCNYAYQDTLEPWLALHAAHGSNWHFTYGPRFMLSEDESPRRYVACLTMGNCWRIQCAVTSREQSMRPTSSTGQIMQDIIRSAARCQLGTGMAGNVKDVYTGAPHASIGVVCEAIATTKPTVEPTMRPETNDKSATRI
ncbi:hypothetical protein B0A48_08384 [Cryoendolithus antarcticus]|uniref:Uncharacterized protein n=1 Tax=Cryoendolithus antarcticus TaxID=1507870 RepID=A0A1V8T5L5_9PEZI|nr:hypothetical protein B0A48_08384 [Cryoendolithus antarcticus]